MRSINVTGMRRSAVAPGVFSNEVLCPVSRGEEPKREWPEHAHLVQSCRIFIITHLINYCMYLSIYEIIIIYYYFMQLL